MKIYYQPLKCISLLNDYLNTSSPTFLKFRTKVFIPGNKFINSIVLILNLVLFGAIEREFSEICS